MADGFEGFDRVVRRVHQLATDTRHVERTLGAIGEYLVGSVRRTIVEGGRPKPFTPLAASTVAARRHGKGRGGSKPLVNMGHLRDSIDKKVGVGDGGSSVEIGTNYGPLAGGGSIAALLHFGGRKNYTIVPKNKRFLAFTGAEGQKILARKVNHPPAPARPFMVVQIPEDVNKSAQIVERYLARK